MIKYHSCSKIVLSLFIILFSVKSFSKAPSVKNEKPLIVVIDPGHGGKDPGAVNKGVREKDVVLGVGLKLGKLINEHFPDVKVIYTRSTDVFVPLIDRSRIANKNKANLFISIHANTCGTPAIKGTETFTLGLHRSNENLEVAKKENSVILLEDNYSTTYEGFDPNSPESYIMFELTQDIYMDQSLSFADDIQRQFQNRLESVNRGVKQAGFLVLRQSSMPSVLIETGFLSNPSEAKYLNSEEGQQTIAHSVFEAFRKFKSRNSTGAIAAKTDAKSKEKTESIPAELKSSSDTENNKPTPKNNPDLAPDEGNNDSLRNDKTSAKATVPEKETIEKTEPANKQITDSQTTSETYYSIQIGANTTPVDPLPSNFKGLKEVRREKTDKYYRYYIGKDASLENIQAMLKQIKVKYPQAFVVAFTDGKRTILDTGLK